MLLQFNRAKHIRIRNFCQAHNVTPVLAGKTLRRGLGAERNGFRRAHAPCPGAVNDKVGFLNINPRIISREIPLLGFTHVVDVDDNSVLGFLRQPHEGNRIAHLREKDRKQQALQVHLRFGPGMLKDGHIAVMPHRLFGHGNTHIFRQGAAAEHFYLLLDGHLRVVKVTEHGEQVIARYISTGELFGIAVAISRDIYPANAIAAVDCVALVWPNSVWQPTIEKNPSFATNTYRTIGDRLQETQDRLVELSTERVEQRVASALLKLVRQTGRQTDEGVLIDFPISRQDLSEMTGTTLHTVSRLLSAWEIAGLIKSGRQRITVVEDHKVMRIAHGQK